MPINIEHTENGTRIGLAILVLACGALGMRAQVPTIPPSLSSLTPVGVRRGSTVVVTVEGRNLSGARGILFDAPGLTAKVLNIRELPENVVFDLKEERAPVPLGVRQEAKLELAAAPDVESGLHRFRVETPRGTSNTLVLDVGVLPEFEEKEPNDSESRRVELPATLVGTVGRPGYVASFEFNGRAGQEMVFEVVAASLGSALRSHLSLQGPNGQIVTQAGEFSRARDAVLTSTLPADGKYTISISDVDRRGGSDYFYRLNAGALPYVTEVFPLGLRAGQPAELELRGVNLGNVRKLNVQAPSSASEAGGGRTIPLRVKSTQGESLNRLRLAVGNEPDISESEPNDGPDQAQHVTIPVTINGHISGHQNGASVDEDYFRFTARKGQRLVVEVAASRLGSPLDSLVEVLDSKGREIAEATVRCLAETSLALGDVGSKDRDFRLISVKDLHPNDYLMAGEELVQIASITEEPNRSADLKRFQGQRIAFENTTPQAHSVSIPIYKAQILKPGEAFPPNGLPVFRLMYRNDDGGPGYGQDSLLDFTAPEDGEYVLHLKDARGLEGEDFAYRLTIREPNPDFTLTASPSNVNVPLGGRVPITVTADRRLGYQGAIDLEIAGLPSGVRASPATILTGQDSTVVTLAAVSNAAEGAAAPFKIVGRAQVEGHELVRAADGDDPLRVASLIPPPDLVISIEPHEITLKPGKEATFTVKIARRNGFRGRVPCHILNLPPGVFVEAVGLNGVLVNEDESSRTIKLRAEDWVRPTEQPLYAVGTVESVSPTEHASDPLNLKVRAKTAPADSVVRAAIKR